MFLLKITEKMAEEKMVALSSLSMHYLGRIIVGSIYEEIDSGEA